MKIQKKMKKNKSKLILTKKLLILMKKLIRLALSKKAYLSNAFKKYKIILIIIKLFLYYRKKEKNSININ